MQIKIITGGNSMTNNLRDFEAVSWENIFFLWKMFARHGDSELMEKFHVELIQFDRKNYPHDIVGYDWIMQKHYDTRLKTIIESPLDFMLSNDFLNKGTLATLGMLAQAKDNPENVAAIWILAFIKEIEENLPVKWRGKGYRIISEVEWEIREKLGNQFSYWHHAMRNLVPHVYFSYDLLENINIDSYEIIIELAAINAMLTLKNYKAVFYDTRDFKEK